MLSLNRLVRTSVPITSHPSQGAITMATVVRMVTGETHAIKASGLTWEEFQRLCRAIENLLNGYCHETIVTSTQCDNGRNLHTIVFDISPKDDGGFNEELLEQLRASVASIATLAATD